MLNIKKNIASIFYRDNKFNCDAVRILPGEYFFTNKYIVMTTVLGSCVSACIYDPFKKIGGMNHFLLPDSLRCSDVPVEESMRYGLFAMDTLIRDIIEIGAVRKNMLAKIFGGGNVLDDMKTLKVGSKNSYFVINYLKRSGIKIVAEDMEDIYPRKIYFSPITGKVMVKKLKASGFLPYSDVEMACRNSFN